MKTFIEPCGGLRMPGEFEPHRGCMMIWPYRPGSWPFGAEKARHAFAAVASAISESEAVYLLTRPEDIPIAKEMVSERIRIVPMESDDAWARDTGPTFVTDRKGKLFGVDWQFNAWGGTYNGLFSRWERDDKIASSFCAYLGVPCLEARPFVLEGGSIHSDGEGTVLATEECLLSPGRNPSLSRTQIEEKLRAYLGAEKVLWIPYGIYRDETDGHVDNICAFLRPGEAVLAWAEDKSDVQYARSAADLEVLLAQTDARGRKLTVHKLPIPAKPVCVTEEETAGFSYEKGERQRTAGERLAASYVNFYFANGSVILPAFGDKNDGRAAAVLGSLLPERKIISIPARDILLGGGNIHCITQQIPKGGD